jgi:hypothetical protein
MRFIIILTLLLCSHATYGSHFDGIATYLSGQNADTEHSSKIQNLWQKYNNNNLSEIRKWQKAQLSASLQPDNSELVFYPFSGPDVVHMLSFFPHEKTYMMIGLEDAGSPNDLALNRISLEQLRLGIDSLLERSFFVTSEMWGDFAKAKQGVLTPMLTLLKLMNYNILSVDQVYLNHQGQMGASKTDAKGIKILIQTPGSSTIQEIYYFSASLTNNHRMIQTYLNQHQKIITYLKAAQYALFSPEFSQIRRVILDKSSIILQDDSGIPYHFFNSTEWDIALFGKYLGPYGDSFKGYQQPSLKIAYRNAPDQPINFSLGYGYRKTQNCLMKMVKKDKPAGQSHRLLISNSFVIW